MWDFLTNLLVFIDFDFFQPSFKHSLSVMNGFKQCLSHTKSLNIFYTLYKRIMERVPHILRTFANFWVFLDFYSSENHLTTA